MGLLWRSPKTPDYKRPPLRQSINGSYQGSPNGRYYKEEYEVEETNNGSSLAKRICTAISLILLVTTILVSLALAILYVNCTTVEVIPKSHDLCHDIYQFMQTGRIGLTWDYKASANETVQIVKRTFANVTNRFESFVNTSSIKDDLFAGAAAIRDSIFGLPKWMYENFGHVLRYGFNFAYQSFRYLKRYTYRFFNYVAHSSGMDRIKLAVADGFDSISYYLEKAAKKVKAE